MPLLVASHNQGKLREFAALLAECGQRVVGLAEMGITAEAPETGDTFEANAVQKARYYHDLTGLPTVADDSGLVVDALDGAPGVLSARYGGPGLDDRGRVDLLLRELAGAPPDRRTARFVSVIALVWHEREPRGDGEGSGDGDGEPARTRERVETFEGMVEGVIAWEPAGSGGFGYDPVFVLPDRGLTLAQVDPAIKNRLSHRAVASGHLLAYLERHPLPLPGG